MSKPATHILIDYPSRKTTLLYRSADGCALACRIETKVLAGEDPNPAKLETRNYLDEVFARMALKALAERDVVATHGEGFAARFDERDGESRLVAPNGQISLARN